jgi:hypothetical protein
VMGACRGWTTEASTTLRCSRTRWTRGDRFILKLGLTATLLVVWGCADATPATPANAVMEYLTAAQLGDSDDLMNGLCERLRDDPDGEELATINRVVHEASVFGQGVSSEGENVATVRLEVLFSPAPRGARGEPWKAHLVKESGRWTVCGFEPVGP